MLFAYHSPEQNLNFFELELKKKTEMKTLSQNNIHLVVR